MLWDITIKRFMSFSFPDSPHQPQLQASSSPIPRIQIWSIQLKRKHYRVEGKQSSLSSRSNFILLTQRVPTFFQKRNVSDAEYTDKLKLGYLFEYLWLVGILLLLVVRLFFAWFLLHLLLMML